jgi:hypothetical protein
MRDPSEWLPPLLRLEDFGGDWRRYIDAVYAVFERDFITSQTTFQGARVSYRRRDRGQEPPEGKASTFWHVVTEGGADPDRLPDLRRCERIGWIRALIDAASVGEAYAWENDERGEPRVLIAPPDFSHIVVLARREGYLLLVTAFPVDLERRRQRFRLEYEAWARGKTS